MKLFLIACLLSVFGVVASSAQTLTKNSDGEQIITYPDGTWRYFNQTPPGEAPAIEPTPPEEEEYSKPEFDAEAEARARAVLRTQIQTELKEIKKLEKIAAKLKKKEEKEETRIASLRASSAATSREEISVANRRLQDTRRLAADAQLEVETAQKRVASLEQSLPMTRAKRKDFLSQAGLIEELNQDGPAVLATDFDEMEFEDGQSPATTQNKSTKQVATQAAQYKTYSLKNDPRYSPPEEECSYTYNGVDEFTQKRRLNLTPRLFFGHTNPELKPYLGDESLVTCTGALSQNGGYLILELEFVIRSQYANKEFGVLPRGSQLSIKMIDNEKVTLRNQTLSQGKFDPVEKVFSYKARYTISKSQKKTLEKNLVDQVRVMWGTGFDDYAIYEVDFFQRQLRCL